MKTSCSYFLGLRGCGGQVAAWGEGQIEAWGVSCPPSTPQMTPMAEGWSLDLDGVLQQWSAAKIVLSLANNIAEFLEEVLQLLLLDGRQVFWDRWQAKRLGGNWPGGRVGDGDNL